MTRLENRTYLGEHRALMKEPKICIIIKSLANGGAEKQSILLAKALKDQYAVHYVVLNETPQHHAHLTNLSKYQIDHTFLKGGTLAKAKQFIALLNAKRINLLFTFLPGDTFFAGITGRMAGVQYILGGLRSAVIPERRKKFGLRIIHNYFLDATISNSYTGKQFYKDHGFNDDKTLVIHNGMIIDTQYQERTDSKNIKLLSVGRFVEQKDYETAIKTIALLKKSNALQKPFHYTIIGEGKLEQQVRDWVKSYKCEDVIDVVIDPDNIPEYYQKSDIYLCSSIFEGLSNTLIEASSFSMPIVATDAGDNNQLVLNGESGYITPIGDVTQLAAKLTVLINSHEKRIEMGKVGFEHLNNSFSYERFQERYLELVKTLMIKNDIKALIEVS